MRSGVLARALSLSLTTGTGLILATAVADATPSQAPKAAPQAHAQAVAYVLPAVLPAHKAAVHKKAVKKAVHKKTVHHKAALSPALTHQLAALRGCESGGNYRTNTGNGFYGAYQFDSQTWHGLGYHGLPSSNSSDAQDDAAAKLHAQRGWQPWPSCSRSLGLR